MCLVQPLQVLVNHFGFEGPQVALLKECLPKQGAFSESGYGKFIMDTQTDLLIVFFLAVVLLVYPVQS